MDAPLERLPGKRRPKPLRLLSEPPFVEIRYWQAPDADEDSGDRSADAPLPDARPPTPIARSRGMAHDLYRRMRTAVRDSRARALFGAYRPYEQYEPGPLSPNIAATVQRHGFSYMLSKSGFGTEPRVLLQSGPFVVLTTRPVAGMVGLRLRPSTTSAICGQRSAASETTNSRRGCWVGSTPVSGRFLGSCGDVLQAWKRSRASWRTAARQER